MRYHEVSLQVAADPLTLLHRLATELPRPWIVYERGEAWSFAAGALGEVWVDRRHLVHTCDGLRRSERLSGRPLADVARVLSRLPLPSWRAYGWVAFEYGYLRAQLPVPVPDLTLLHLIVPSIRVRIDSNRCVIGSVDRQQAARLGGLLGEPSRAAEIRLPRATPVPVVAAGRERYQQMVAHTVQEIRSGRLQKAILSRRVPVGFTVDMLATYRLGRPANKPARSFLLNTAQMRAVGFSPETVLTAGPDGRVHINPLAGTRAMLGDDGDLARAAVLRTDPKEVFEHAIAVKQVLDELGQVCVPGSVVIDDYLSVISRGSVQHLGSQVSGRLRHDRTCWDALEAVFPAVTAAGVPKTAALECISRLEPHPRRLYGGAVLTASHDGTLDAALALRTLFEQDGAAWLQAGAGIVATSDPVREYEETCEKLRSVAPYIVPMQATTTAPPTRDPHMRSIPRDEPGSGPP